MSRYLLLSILLLCGAEYGFAQRNFQKGYLVRKSGDTLSCYIDYQDWSDSPTEVYYKKDLSQKEELTTALSSQGFYLENTREMYESHTVTLLYVGENMYETRPDNYFSQTLFLQKLWSNSHLSLYFGQSEKDGRARFFVKDSTSLHELIQYSFFKNQNGQNYRVNVDTYKTQLRQFTADAEHFSMPVPIYSERYLIRYFQAYNEKLTGGKPAEFSKKEEHPSWYAGVNIGSERLNITDITRKDHNLSIGLSLRINFPRNHQNTFVRAAFHVTPQMTLFEEVTKIPRQGSMKNLEIQAGQYIGGGKIQPFYTLGMTFFSSPAKSFGFITPSVGISYKKQLELELAHFSPLFFQIQDETPFLIPTRITLSYFLKVR